MTTNVNMVRIITCIIFLVLCPSEIDAQGSTEKMFSVRSIDVPHPLWAGLKSTMTEIQKDGQVSLFSVEHKEGAGSKGANGRFLLCIAGMLAEKREYNFFRNSGIVNNRMLVVFQKSENEDSKAIETKYSEYTLFEAAPVEMMKEMCGF